MLSCVSFLNHQICGQRNKSNSLVATVAEKYGEPKNRNFLNLNEFNGSPAVGSKYIITYSKEL